MIAPIILHGYRFSVYSRIARIVLEEKGVEYAMVEVDPFAKKVPRAYRELHPFGRVPVLSHGEFVLYETSAIERYIDSAFPSPPLTPTEAPNIARMAQVVAIIDNYGYWPISASVFTQRVPAISRRKRMR